MVTQVASNITEAQFLQQAVKTVKPIKIHTKYVHTVVRKFFDRKYFIDKKIQGKIFSLTHDFLEIFLP